MPIEQRIRLCLLIEKLTKKKEYGQKLGLEDTSRFHGKRIGGEKGEKQC